MSEHDDCCGPMVAAFLRDYSVSWDVVSAGRTPAPSCPPLMVLAMRECLIDLAGYRPRPLDSLDVSMFDVVYECDDTPCPGDMDACRVLRDRVKNESFIFYKQSLSSM